MVTLIEVLINFGCVLLPPSKMNDFPLLELIDTAVAHPRAHPCVKAHHQVCDNEGLEFKPFEYFMLGPIPYFGHLAN